MLSKFIKKSQKAKKSKLKTKNPSKKNRSSTLKPLQTNKQINKKDNLQHVLPKF